MTWNFIEVDSLEGKKQPTNPLNYSPTLATEHFLSINLDNISGPLYHLDFRLAIKMVCLSQAYCS